MGGSKGSRVLYMYLILHPAQCNINILHQIAVTGFPLNHLLTQRLMQEHLKPKGWRPKGLGCIYQANHRPWSNHYLFPSEEIHQRNF